MAAMQGLFLPLAVVDCLADFAAFAIFGRCGEQNVGGRIQRGFAGVLDHAEICAAFKNVIAIAVGASYGIGLGDNTAALIMTRGLAEMSRLVEACGGTAMTGAMQLRTTCFIKIQGARAPETTTART